jgi:hypothetical protein
MDIIVGLVVEHQGAGLVRHDTSCLSCGREGGRVFDMVDLSREVANKRLILRITGFLTVVQTPLDSKRLIIWRIIHSSAHIGNNNADSIWKTQILL